MNLKTVSYRGGIVSFGIPSHWREEYAPDGQGTFYDRKPGMGTLRLSVISFEKDFPMTIEAVAREIFAHSLAEQLPNRLVLRRYIKDAEERGTALHLHRWEMLVPVPPTRWRVVCFTHTSLAAQARDPAILDEIELINTSVREAIYSTEPGVLPTKPWWRFW